MVGGFTEKELKIIKYGSPELPSDKWPMKV